MLVPVGYLFVFRPKVIVVVEEQPTLMLQNIQPWKIFFDEKEICASLDVLFPQYNQTHQPRNRNLQISHKQQVLSKAYISASTRASFPLKKGFKAGLIDSNLSCRLTSFSILLKTCKFDLSSFSIVWLLHKI